MTSDQQNGFGTPRIVAKVARPRSDVPETPRDQTPEQPGQTAVEGTDEATSVAAQVPAAPESPTEPSARTAEHPVVVPEAQPDSQRTAEHPAVVPQDAAVADRTAEQPVVVPEGADATNHTAERPVVTREDPVMPEDPADRTMARPVAATAASDADRTTERPAIVPDGDANEATGERPVVASGTAHENDSESTRPIPVVEAEPTQPIADDADSTHVAFPAVTPVPVATAHPETPAERTHVLPMAALPVEDEAERTRRAEEARAERERRQRAAEQQRQDRLVAQQERDRVLGTVTPAAAAAPTVQAVTTRNTDKFLGSFGLFMLRLVTAAILGIHGFNQLTKMSETTAFVKTLPLPYPDYLAWALAAGSVLAAVLLVFGFLVRVAGFGVLVGAALSLAFVQWGKFQIMQGNGFLGEKDLLLAAVGLLFMCVGGGGWGLDAGFRRSRANRT